MDQEFYKRHGMADLKDDNGTSKTLSAAARRSFFRRRLKHKRSGSKDGKDLTVLEVLGADSLPITEGVTWKPGILIRVRPAKERQGSEMANKGRKNTISCKYLQICCQPGGLKAEWFYIC